jgi:hypothetical protein
VNVRRFTCNTSSTPELAVIGIDDGKNLSAGLVRRQMKFWSQDVPIVGDWGVRDSALRLNL